MSMTCDSGTARRLFAARRWLLAFVIVAGLRVVALARRRRPVAVAVARQARA